MTIKEKLKNLPKCPGVYVMKNKEGSVIYVGKAIVLKNRVSQYFTHKQNILKVQKMVDNIADFDYFVVNSENEALALEKSLTEKYQPFYNILLKDDKQFAYIKVNLKEQFPKVEVVRRIKEDGSKYFGPYITGISANQILKIIHNAFKIRKCTVKIDKCSHKQCLNYSLGLCFAPCVNKDCLLEYEQQIKKVISFLNGNEEEVINKLKENMTNAAKVENFELALTIKKQIDMVEKLKEKTITSVPKNLNIDVFSCVKNELGTAICLMNVRAGKVLGIKCNIINNENLTQSEVLSEVLIQYYNKTTLPDEIFLSHRLDMDFNDKCLEKILSKISYPQKGVKKQLVNLAIKNAENWLDKEFTRQERQKRSAICALSGLQKAFNLKTFPTRIECYDISHQGGQNMVGSMVVFINGMPAKKEYRKFKIKSVDGNNDFACLQEVLKRRLTHLDENDEKFKCPNLVIIDGGKGQLSSVQKIAQSYADKYNFNIISLAKKFEEVFVYNNGKFQNVLFNKSSDELKLLQRVRDEAHRFAITFHKALKNKNLLSR